MIKNLIPYLAFLLFLFASCNREHLKIERNNDPQGYADSQVVGNWKITAMTSDVPYDWDQNGSVETDIYNLWSECQKDHLYTFVGDKTGTFKINCSTTEAATWQIIQTQYLVYSTASLGLQSEQFISMTSVQFKTIIKLSLPSGQPVTITKIWSRQ